MGFDEEIDFGDFMNGKNKINKNATFYDIYY
jgi:hypothetical protein